MKENSSKRNRKKEGRKKTKKVQVERERQGCVDYAG